MAVCFGYLVKSELSSVRLYIRLHGTSPFSQGTRKTRPYLSGEVVCIWKENMIGLWKIEIFKSSLKPKRDCFSTRKGFTFLFWDFILLFREAGKNVFFKMAVSLRPDPPPSSSLMVVEKKLSLPLFLSLPPPPQWYVNQKKCFYGFPNLVLLFHTWRVCPAFS